MRFDFKIGKSKNQFFEWYTKTTSRFVVIVTDSRRWGSGFRNLKSTRIEFCSNYSMSV